MERAGAEGYKMLHEYVDGPPNAIVLFDDACAFCFGAVKFIAQRDPQRYFRFGGSQSLRAAALVSRYGLTSEMTRSIILIESGEVFLRSTATLRIARRLPWPWSMARVFLYLPLPVRDAAYRLIAAMRRWIAGTSNACDVPSPEIRERMI
jgi:predicted DCC family thiol-disulfide oxidoreductase YuxK